ncbi:hypothetical protein P3S67_015344 [Capsicum chacoense]
MSSSYEYLSTGKFYHLSHLEKLRQKWELRSPGMNNWSDIYFIYMNLKFLDMFLSLQRFTNACCDVTQKVQAVFPYAVSEMKRIYNLYKVRYMLDKLDEKIWEIKLEIRAKYSFPQASQPLPSNVAITEFVKRFIDTVLMNLSDLTKMYDPYSWSLIVPSYNRQQMGEVVKELKLLRNFVYFISDRLASARMNASVFDLQMKIQPIQPCVRKIYIDVLQALKSGWHPNIQAEDVADYKAAFVETLIHHLETLPVTFKDQMTMPGFLDSSNIQNHLKWFLSCYSDALSSIRTRLWKIQQQLEHFQKKHDGDGSFAMQVISKAYEVNHLVVGDYTNLREVAEIHENKVSDLVLNNTTDVASDHTSEFARITSMTEEMVGFQEVMNTLRRQLIRGSSNLDVVSIVGMPGLGKTTLANKLFFDQLVVSHFDVRAQCCVSQAYTRKDLLLTIIRGVEKDDVISDKLPENELEDKLRKLLLVQRYLILVDDVWEKIA